MTRFRISRQRATVLIMVVSLLALLFVIVTGFINLARVDRQNQVQVRSSDRADRVLDDIVSLASGLIGAQLRDGDGGVLGGKDAKRFSQEDIPGYRYSHWLAAIEPVWNYAFWPRPRMLVSASSRWWPFNVLSWGAVTSLSGDSNTRPRAFAIAELVPESDTDTISDPMFGEVVEPEDFENDARRPLVDADADGVPDADFVAVALATELANAMAGTPIRLVGTGLNINAIPNPNQIPPDERLSVWRQFRERARYATAVRIVSHGGMLALDAAPVTLPMPVGDRPPFNRKFTSDLFHAIRHPLDRRSNERLSQYPAPGGEDALFRDLASYRGDVEAALRRRGGLLAGPENEELIGNTRYYTRNVPPVLSWLQGEPRRVQPNQPLDLPGLDRTFLPPFDLVGTDAKRNTWDRFNLGDPSTGISERDAWVRSAALNPVLYNSAGTQEQALSWYARRPFLTTTSYSDELARKQDDGEPTKPLFDASGIDLKTYRGERKFWLGDIANAFDVIGSRQYAYDQYLGRLVVERLARLYSDMLESHASGSVSSKWGDVHNTGPGAFNDDDAEVVSRRQQAFMLAVNTVAFAMPRDVNVTPGWVDVVSYVDPISQTEYIGYGPQPFFSEAIAYAREDNADPNEAVVALAVELFNPQDPYDANGDALLDDDPFALNLHQFAIAIGSTNPNMTPEGTGWKRLSQTATLPTDRFPGRSFRVFVFKEPGSDPNNPASGNSHFDSLGHLLPPLDTPPAFTVGDLPAGRTQITLWRAGRFYRSDTQALAERWYCVDRFDIDMPDDPERWSSRWRDLSTTREFGDGNGNPDPGPLPPARWSVVTAYNDSDTQPPLGGGGAGGSGGSGEITESQGSGSPARESLGTEQYYDSGGLRLPTAFAPRVPLLTMNAGPAGGGFLYTSLNNYPMFANTEDLRPRSFPTPGFLLFVPRYAHVHKVAAIFGNPLAQAMIAPNGWRTMSQTLEKERVLRDYGANDAPADFGHMPIFNNRPDVDGSSYLGQVGRLPWGLLVFDYFTTLKPDAPGVDPLRVPGRININAAPWYLLSRLPLLGPVTADYDGDGLFDMPLPAGSVPAAWPSPAFWSSECGVLVGQGIEADMLDPLTPGVGRVRLPLYYSGDERTSLTLGVPLVEDAANGLYRLGPWLAQSAAAYRDGVQMLPFRSGEAWAVYSVSHLRNGTGDVADDTSGAVIGVPPAWAYRSAGAYGSIRGQTSSPADGLITSADRPGHFGFVSVGELANVCGFDASWYTELPAAGAPPASTSVDRRDFVKAVSLLALLDTQYLTTRSHTFTVYTSVIDRQEPQASIRAQVTLDRSNLLPRLEYTYLTGSRGQRLAVPAVVSTGNAIVPIRVTNDGAAPEVLVQRRAGYFNARFDD